MLVGNNLTMVQGGLFIAFVRIVSMNDHGISSFGAGYTLVPFARVGKEQDRRKQRN